jgi:hypothetical protein
MRKITVVKIDDGVARSLVECPICGDLVDVRDSNAVPHHDCGSSRSFEQLQAETIARKMWQLGLFVRPPKLN